MLGDGNGDDDDEEENDAGDDHFGDASSCCVHLDVAFVGSLSRFVSIRVAYRLYLVLMLCQ